MNLGHIVRVLIPLLLMSLPEPAKPQQGQAQKPTAPIQALLNAANASKLGPKDQLAKCQDALNAAVTQKDRPGEALSLLYLAQCYLELNQLRPARDQYAKAIPIFTELGDLPNEANALVGIGEVYQTAGYPRDAIPNYNKALPILKQLKMRAQEADVWGDMGVAYRVLGEYAKALEYYDKALPVERELGLRNEEASILNNIGFVYAQVKRHLRALEYYNQALTIETATGDHRREARTLDNIGQAHMALHQMDQADKDYSSALVLWRKVKDRDGEATTICNTGALYDLEGKNRDALAQFQQALPMLHEVNDRPGEAVTLEKIAVTLALLGRQDEAIDYNLRELAIYRDLKSQRGEGAALNSIGYIYSQKGDNPKALDYYLRALPVRLAAKDRDGEATTLNNIGGIHKVLAQPEEALAYFNRSLTIRRQLDDRAGIAICLSNIGWTYDTLGKKQKAIEFYNRALEIEEELDLKQTLATTLNNIGTVHETIGEKALALQFFKRSLEIRRGLGWLVGEGRTLDNIGQVYGQMGDSEMALKCFNDALAMRVQAKDKAGEGVTLGNMAQVYAGRGQTDKALSLFKRSLSLSQGTGDVAECSRAVQAIAAIYERTHQTQLAMNEYVQAMILTRQGHDRVTESTALAGLGQLEKATAPRAAVWLTSMSVRMCESLRADISGLGPGARRSLAETTTSRYLLLADQLAQQGRTPELLQALALSKTDAASGLVGRIPESAVEEKWTRGYEAHLKAAVSTAQDLDRLRSIKSDDAEHKRKTLSLTKASDEAESRLRQYLAIVIKESKQVRSSTDRVERTDASTTADKTIHSLPSGSTMVFVVPAADKLDLLVIRSGHRVIRTSRTMQLQSKVTAFNAALQDEAADPRPLGKELYELLVKPIEHELSSNGVTMWSLCGFLRTLPVGALWDGKQYLAERFPSSSFSPAFIASLAAKPRNAHGALVLGTTGMRTVKDPITEEPISFPALPGVDQETTAVGSALNSAALLDKEFSLSSLRDGLGKNPSVVHLASHFCYVPGDDRRSFLLTGDGGEWTVDAMKSLADNALGGIDLVTLSACATAEAQTATGDEAESFGAWMQRKGAKAVISTLWPIADESTAMLMSEFYRFRKSHPNWTKLQALRQAQMEMVHGQVIGATGANRSASRKPSKTASNAPRWPKGMPRYAHPYYWAPFVLSGNWR